MIGVLISSGYGAGWSTWNNDQVRALMTMHHDIIQAVLDKKYEEAGEIATKLVRQAMHDDDKYVDTLGVDELEVNWVTKGHDFEITEYDGHESLHIIGERDYFTA